MVKAQQSHVFVCSEMGVSQSIFKVIKPEVIRFPRLLLYDGGWSHFNVPLYIILNTTVSFLEDTILFLQGLLLFIF